MSDEAIGRLRAALSDEVVAAAPPETYRRLRELKGRYDPDDLFRPNRPIPALSAA